MRRLPGSIGIWMFSRLDKRVLRHDAETLGAMVEIAQQTLEILGSNGLLRPSQLTLQSWSTPFGASRNESFERDNPRVEIAIPDFGIVPAAQMSEKIVEATRPIGTFPKEIHFSGIGSVYESDGTSITIPNPVRLTIEAMFEVTAIISTDIDVWLPYDLYANEQWDVWAANAPRLAKALQDLAMLPNVEASHIEHTHWAEVDATEVRNHIDSLGRPVRILAD